MQKYIHNETGFPVTLLHKNIMTTKGKPTVILQQQTGRIVQQQQKKFFKEYTAEHIKVFINLNNELGKDKYSVALMEHPTFWFDSFKTKEEAENFIKSNTQFKSTRFIDTRSG